MKAFSPGLRQILSQSRFLPRETAQARTQGGERRSRTRGPGIEFQEHRLYEQGDDLRHLDRHVYERLGQYAIRQSTLDRGLSVSILIDTSRSMAYGQPSKLEQAFTCAAALALVGLAGGDEVRIGTFSASGVDWSPRTTGARRLARLSGWLGDHQANGQTNLAQSARQSVRGLAPSGLLFVISDWLDEESATALTSWSGRNRELIAVQVLAAEELEPELLGGGAVRVIDAENGLEVETSLDSESIRRYRDNLAVWLERLEREVARHHGRYLLMRADESFERNVLPRLRASGIIS